MKKYFPPIALAFAIATISTGSALADRVGPQLDLSEHEVAVELSTPDVAALRNGGFVATWYGKGGTPRRSSYLRVFDSEGVAQGPRLAIDQGSQMASAVQVVGLSDGSFMVLWNGAKWAQRYDESGEPLGPIFKTRRSGRRPYTDVAALRFGGFITAFSHGGKIVVKRYSNSGNIKKNKKFVIRNDDEYLFGRPEIHAAPGGGFLIAALSQPRSQDDLRSILFWRVNRKFEAVASKIVVAEGIPEDNIPYRLALSVNSLEDGGSFVTWAERGDGTDQNKKNVHVQFLARDNQPAGTQLAFGARGSRDPVGVGLEGGNAMLAWTRGGNYNSDIAGRRFESDGQSSGKSFRIDDVDRGRQYTPAIAALPGSKAIVIWLSKPAHDVLGQIVD
ncbi:hypothetical protein [Microbaculum marinum]|uniref:Uncharacterized protein n=1 Tax=Microbaculum marinum TaxID=1764581 RepID=A0AAW9RNA3_9HYPH